MKRCLENDIRSDNIHIAYVIDSLQLGGTEKQLCSTINRLDRTKVQPYLICLRESDPAVINLIDCPLKQLSLRSFKSCDLLLSIRHFTSFLRREQIDIVQTFFIDATLFGVMGAKLAGVPKIISSRRDLAFWYNRVILGSLMITNRFVDRFLVNSLAVKNHLTKWENIPDHKIDLIYNGIDIDQFNVPNSASINGIGPAKAKSGPLVGIVANLNREVKRVDLFIQAARIIKNHNESASFIVIGDGNLRPHLEALAKKLEVDDRMIFSGMKREVAREVKSFDIGVICSDSEGFSNSILEYMASGIPTVATNVGGNSEIISDGVNGFLVPRRNAEALASRILQLIQDKKLRRRMGTAGRNEVEFTFAWPYKIREIQDYYGSLLQSP